MTNPLVEKQTTALAVMNFEADASAGFEQADKDSYAIPFLRVLQALSPQLEKGNAEFIQGATAGAILDTINSTLFDGEVGVMVIPCHYSRTFIEWVPRDAGGGYVAEHPPESPVVAQGKRAEKGAALKLPSGNDLMDTRNHFVLARGLDGVWREALISMTSTNISTSKRWMSFMQGRRAFGTSGQPFTMPTYSGVYTLKTVLQRNDKGAWYTWAVEFLHDVDSLPTYEQAKSFARSVKSGKVKVDHASAEPLHGSSSEYVPGADDEHF